MYGYSLSAKRNYTAFQGEISVKYSYPSNITLPDGRVQLVNLKTGSVVMSVPMVPGFSEAELTFQCGAVDHAGKFVFQMVRKNGGEVLKETEVMYVKWPTFQLTLPVTHKVLEGSVTLKFAPESSLCRVVNKDSTFTIDVNYYGKDDSTLHIEDVIKNRPKILVHRQEIQEFYQMREVSMTFNCSLIDLAGIYQVHFTFLKQISKPIAVSNIMIAEWSNKYSLEYQRPSIFPCRSYVTIVYDFPQCTGNEDKIRLYKMIRITESSRASPTNLVYVGEARVKISRSTVSFECSQFHEVNRGYCFKYVSMAKKGAVSEQEVLCIPTQNQPGEIFDKTYIFIGFKFVLFYF